MNGAAPGRCRGRRALTAAWAGVSLAAMVLAGPHDDGGAADLEPQPPLASVSRATVALGVGGVTRTGAWTPLVVRLPQTAAGGRLRAWVEDADGQFVASPPAALSDDGAGQAVAQACVRPGRPRVRVLIEELAEEGQGAAAATTPTGSLAVLAARPGTEHASTTPLVLVRGRVPATAAATRLVAGEGTAMAVVPLDAAAPGVSLRPRDLDAFDAAIICGTAVAGLDGGTLTALDGWVRRGGRLVFAAGASAVAVAAAGGPAADWLPGAEPRLVPLRRLGAIEAYARSGGLGGRLPATGLSVPRFEAAGITGVVEVFEGDSPADLPLVVRRAHGFGTITWIGLDIDQPWCGDWAGCDRLVAALLGGRSEAERPVTPTEARRRIPDLAGQLRVALDTFAATPEKRASLPVPFEVIAGLGILYCLALYPLDWWIVRRSGRPWLSWITLPLMAGGFAAAAWAVGSAWGRDAPARLRDAEVIDFDAAGGLVRGSAWAAARSPANGRFDVAVVGDDRVAPDRRDTAVSWLADAGTGFGAVDAAVAHPSLAATDYAYGGSLAVLESVPVAAASSRLFEASWFGAAGRPAADATLTRDGRGLLTGSVTFRLSVPLERCWLVHGGWLYDVGRMEPGDTFDTETGRGPRSLAAALTRRAAVKDRDRAERWDAGSIDIDRILELAGLHAAAGGPGYTGLEAGRLGRLDLSPLLAVDRAVLVGTVPRGTRLTHWTVRLREARAAADLSPEPAATGLVRIVLPVRTAVAAEAAP